MKALIDGDILVYKIGFTADDTYYLVRGRKFKYSKDAKDWCKKKNIHYAEIEKRHVAGDLEEAKDMMDDMVEGVLDATSAEEYQVFLTGKGNFRDEVGVTVKYKGNRSGGGRPHHYQNLRDHLVNVWGATVVDGMEADDALGINQTENTIICSIDKDLLTIPGKHYNWNKREFIDITEYEGWFNFYRQMLTGDRTDNIFSVMKDTPAQIKKAEHMLAGLSVEEMKCFVGLMYAIEFDSPEERMLENGKLLFIKQNNIEWEL